MNDFPYKGEPAGLVLARLGLPQDTLIKIRRQISPGILRQMSQSLEESAKAVSSLRFPSEFAAQQQAQQSTSAHAIMEANQRTFKAERMYSYRIRAESLWGTKEDPMAQDEKSSSPVVRQDVDASTSSHRMTSRKFSRKRWVSDTDATNLGDGTAQRPADAPNGKGSAAAGASNGAAAVAGDGAGGGLGDLADGETYTDIFPVSAAEPVQAGDVLFLSCAQATMIDFQAGAVSKGLKGLKFLDVSALDLPGHGTEFFEIVLSGHNHFVGRSASRDNAEFAAYYNVSVVAVRRRGQATAAAIPSAPAVSAPPSSARPTATATGSFKRSTLMDAPEVFLEEGVEPALNSDSRVVSPSGSTLTPQSRATVASAAAAGTRTRSRGRSGGGAGSLTFPRSPMTSLLSRKTTNSGGGGQEDGEKDVTESSFKAGDVVLVLAKEEFMEKYGASKDFFLLTKVGSVPKPVRYFDYLPLLAFLGMLIWVLLDADMVSWKQTAPSCLS